MRLICGPPNAPSPTFEGDEARQPDTQARAEVIIAMASTAVAASGDQRERITQAAIDRYESDDFFNYYQQVSPGQSYSTNKRARCLAAYSLVLNAHTLCKYVHRRPPFDNALPTKRPPLQLRKTHRHPPPPQTRTSKALIPHRIYRHRSKTIRLHTYILFHANNHNSVTSPDYGKHMID